MWIFVVKIHAEITTPAYTVWENAITGAGRCSTTPDALSMEPVGGHGDTIVSKLQHSKERMRRRLRFGRWCLPVLVAGICAAGFNPAEALKADTATLSSSPAPSREASVQLNRIILLLAPSAAQEKALDALVAAQIIPGSVSYRQWLTPAQFAARFAVSDADAAQVVAWLEAQGFQVAPLPASRGWIEFSGTAAQVQQAFGAGVKAIVTTTGEPRYELAGQVQIPSAIADAVQGLVSLDGVLSTAAITAPVSLTGGVEALAAKTSLSETQSLTPALARKWVNLPASPVETETGAGESIAILARSNVRAQDFAAFRASFGLPDATLKVTPAGTDPGFTGDESAAIMAASWAGVVGPKAQIVLVPAATTNATDGIDLALAAAVDGALAHTVSVSYAACESSLSAAHQAFYATLYRQAAAEGISIIAASGDSGAAACHAAGSAQPVSTGYAVNGLASTPWNTAVGAVAFAPDASSVTSKALAAWQPSSTSDSAYATGGGASSLYTAPVWQSASGVPASDPQTALETEHHRYLPDVSLPAAASSVRGLAFCLAGNTASDGCTLVSAGGSAASAAIFSGISAVLAQKYGSQGNLAPNLYSLSRHSDISPFVDVTEGSAQLACSIGSAGCADAVSGTALGVIGFSAAAGYDLASGLGSVDAQTLIANWNADATGTTASTTTLTATPSTPETGVTETFVATVAPVTTVSGTTYTLTGTVAFYDGATLLGSATVGSNTATITGISLLDTASHSITAVYSGDSTYASSTSTAVVLAATLATVTVTLTESTVLITPDQSVTLTATVTPVNTPASTAEQHPSGYLLFYANNGVTNALVSGQIPISESTGYSSVGSTVVSNLAAGTYTMTAQYFGDTTYAAAISNSLSLQAEDFTVTCTGVGSSTTSLSVAQGGTINATCTVASLGGLSGTIQLACAEQNPSQVGPISCAFPSPGTVASTGSLTLTIVTTAGDLGQLRRRSGAWPAAGGGLALAFAGLLLSPIGRRARCFRSRAGRLTAIALLLGGMAGASLGCGNKAIGTTNSGTPLGVHTLQITAGSLVNTVTVNHSCYLTVNVTQ